MNVIENDVRALVDKELTAANERFPQFHSAHEGYAVILEEVEECEGEFDAMQYCLNCLWRQTKCNVPTEPKELQNAAVRLACEAIQVAAMCRKFMGMEGGQLKSTSSKSLMIRLAYQSRLFDRRKIRSCFPEALMSKLL